jgi:hypothetical protein
LEQEFGNGWAEGVHPEDLQRCVHHYVSCFERRVPFAMSYRLQDSHGAYRWILDRGAPHSLPDGTFLGYFGGCAEMENDVQLSRHAQLGSMLVAMKDFAQRVATEGVTTRRALRSTTATPLPRAARQLEETHQARLSRIRHAVGELTQLASDMEAYRDIAQGACFP